MTVGELRKALEGVPDELEVGVPEPSLLRPGWRKAVGAERRLIPVPYAPPETFIECFAIAPWKHQDI